MFGSNLFIYFCLLGYSSQISTPDDDSYVGAVVEYQVRSNTSVNLQNYIQFIRDAAEQNADIIVFPELTLAVRENIVVPINSLLKEYPIPALQPTLYDEILVAISAAARQNQIYVVINSEERVDCTNGNVPGESCPEQKVYLFNTNVVFDRTGAVIDRYRKINLFGEYTRTPALSPDLGIFNTDFGVTFGHYICFDLMFQVPSVQIVEKHNITDIIFSTMWFSEMPYLTAVQIQQAYAYSMNVNFLGAGANNVRIGSAGSGIFSGKAGALVSIMPGVPTSKLLVARVPKQPGQVSGTVQGPIYNEPSEQDDLYLITDPSLASHTSRILNTGSSDITLVSGDVVCHFRVQMRQQSGENAPFYRVFAHDGVNVYAKRDVGTVGCVLVACKTEDVKSCVYSKKCVKSVRPVVSVETPQRKYATRIIYKYRVGAYSGLRSYSGVTSGGMRSCSIFPCTDDTIESCGKRFPQYSPNSTGVFQILEITAAVPTPATDLELSAKKSVYFPVSLDTAIMPLNPVDYSFEATQILNAITVYSFRLRNLNDKLYTFAIWGREFTIDVDNDSNNDMDNGSSTPAPAPDSSNINQLHFPLLVFSFMAILSINKIVSRILNSVKL